MRNFEGVDETQRLHLDGLFRGRICLDHGKNSIRADGPRCERIDTHLVSYELGRLLERAAKLQQDIWSRAFAGSRDDPTQNVARLLLPALNDMIDVTTSRTIALHTHLHR